MYKPSSKSVRNPSSNSQRKDFINKGLGISQDKNISSNHNLQSQETEVNDYHNQDADNQAQPIMKRINRRRSGTAENGHLNMQ